MKTVAQKEANRKYMEGYRKVHREKIVSYLREYRTRPEAAAREAAKQSARPEEYRTIKRVSARVAYAVKTGRLVKPDRCEECGVSEKITAAHRDYSEPLAVRWLCYSCHTAWDHAEPKLIGRKHVRG